MPESRFPLHPPIRSILPGRKKRLPGVHRESSRARTLICSMVANQLRVRQSAYPVRLANFDDHQRLAARDSGGARDGFVGAFHGLNRYAARSAITTVCPMSMLAICRATLSHKPYPRLHVHSARGA